MCKPAYSTIGTIVFIGEENGSKEILGLDLEKIQRMIYWLTKKGVEVKLTISEASELASDGEVAQAIKSFDSANGGKMKQGCLILAKPANLGY